MSLLKSLRLAFAMYSRLSVPSAEWEGPHTKYTLCFFPVVGSWIGVCEFAWLALSYLLNVHTFFAAVIGLTIPLLLTGGIHLDGFCDTCDALASHQSRQRKLEILKDSNVGAFAVIGLGIYLLLALGAYVSFFDDLAGEVYTSSPLLSALAVCLLFPLSRSLSGLLAVTQPNARQGGLLFHFTDGAELLRVRLALAIQAAAYAVLMLICAPYVGILLLSGCFIAVMWYISMSRREFGGVTGDLAGWFLQICELLPLILLGIFGNFA